MTSDKKAQANRRNALKSTGPKTPEGKAAVRLNALRHGMRSEELIILPGEDEEALRELSERLRTELQPVGELENLLVDRIVAAEWRLRRLRQVEAGIFASELYGELAERAQREADTYARIDDPLDHIIGVVSGTTSTVTDERKHKQALSTVRELEAARDSETATLGRTFVRDAHKANAFSKFSRYETAIERQIYRALHELERRQAARGGAALTPPQVLDVDVSVIAEDAH
jgi:hypothetical protein